MAIFAAAQPTNWSAKTGGNGHFYEAVAAPWGITWSNASVMASNKGGYLATITSSNENAFVFALANQDTNLWYHSSANAWWGPWLGGFQPPGSLEPAGGWQWITGEPFTYTNWTSGQPNNNGGGPEDHLQIGGQASRAGTWNDLASTNSTYAHSFMVEYDSNPNRLSPTDLTISRSGNQMALSWVPTVSHDFYLGFTTNLPSQTVWNPTADPSSNGGSLVVTDTPAEGSRFYRLQAWETLFDGTSTAAFRGYRQAGFPGTNQWSVTTNGELMSVSNANPVSLVTASPYGSYELRWEWKTSAKGNSGIKYRVNETYSNASSAGPEYQLQDDLSYSYLALQNMGGAFGLFPPTNRVLALVGQWNECRLILQSNHVQHWLNGRVVLDYSINSPAWTNALTALGAPYNVAGFGQGTGPGVGYILLQNLISPTWFRNIKIRPLPAP